ncbi:MAG: prolyl oligopeptidase family serine peptidase [Planctomycetota bacterium]
MNHTPLPTFLLATFLAACSAPAASLSTSAASAMPDVPASAQAKRDAEFAERAAGFVDAFVNTGAAFTRDGSKVVFASNRDGLPQLYVAGSPDEPATRVLTTSQRVSGITPAADGKSVLFMSDTGADECWSFFRVGLDGKNLVELTPGVRMNRDGFVVPDGKPDTLFFSGRNMSEAKSTVYATSAMAAGKPRAIYTDERSAFLADASHDGSTLLVHQYPSRSENYLLRVDAASGKTQRIFPAQGKVSIFDAKFSHDGSRVYVATDGGEEAALVLALDADSGEELARYAVTPHTAGIGNVSVAKQGDTLAVSLTVGNRSEVRLIDAGTLAERTKVDMPLGAGGANEFSEDGKRLAVQWSTPNAPTDLYSVDVATGQATPLRRESRPSLANLPEIETTTSEIRSFDGGKIPIHVYRPANSDHGAKHPVVVSYHGGPAGVSVIRWNPTTAFLLSLGYVVVEPNVRGSSGFGRAFEAADNGPKRLDAFRDIEASGRWVAAQPWTDKDRMVVFGGSYGGYTVLVALSRWPDLWRAGVNLFGVVDLKSFMATTSGVIRDIFLLEFGDPEKDAAFLASISPLTDVDQIVDPTFVYAGANDPRVPRSESDLIVEALRERRVPTEYMVAEDEGHSVARRENLIELMARVARFLETHLQPQG